MRLKSEFWVKAYIRRRASLGQFAAVVRRGDSDAGAIYLKINKLDGSVVMFGPAPSGLDDEGHGDRTWMRLHPLPTLAESDADALIARACDFDSDLWLIEVEDRSGCHELTATEFEPA
jgi:hypothetical protein